MGSSPSPNPSAGDQVKFSDRFSRLKAIIRKCYSYASESQIIYSDKIALVQTSYTATVIAVIIFTALAYQGFNDLDNVSCVLTSNSTRHMDRINEMCKRRGTFIVLKALDPELRDKVDYPGVSDYTRGLDDVIYQSRNNVLFVGLSICAILAMVVHFKWKMLAVYKLKSVLDPKAFVYGRPPPPALDASERCAWRFNERLGWNDSFGRRYLIYRINSLLIPVLIFSFLNLHFGLSYSIYGITYFCYSFVILCKTALSFYGYAPSPLSWPDPSAILFPPVAKCEIVRFSLGPGLNGFGAIVESANCEIPLNFIFPYLFGLVWWMLFFVLMSSFHKFSSIRTSYSSQSHRDNACRKYLERNCGDELGEVMVYRSPSTGRVTFHSLDELIQVNMGFGDFVLIYLLKMNLSESKFRDFIWSVANPKERLPFERGIRIRTPEEIAVERLKKKAEQQGKIRTVQEKLAPIPSSVAASNKGIQVDVLTEKPESIFEKIRREGPSTMPEESPIPARKVVPRGLDCSE